MKALHKSLCSCLHTTPGILALLLLNVCAVSWGQGQQQEQKQNQAEPDARQPAQGDTQATPSEPPEPPRFSSRQDRNRQLLAEAFPEQVRWLELPEPEVEALALYQPPLTANPKGSLLILHSSGRNAQWPPHLENLRRALPYRGWGSLSLSLPAPEPEPVPERPASTMPQAAETESAQEQQNKPAEGTAESGEEQEQEAAGQQDEPPEQEQEQKPEPEPEPLPPREERINNRLDAAMALLGREGRRNLMLLVDSLSAPEVMAYFQAELEQSAGEKAPATGESPLNGPVRALILVNAYPGQALTRKQLEQVFAVDRLPVLDIFMGPGQRQQEAIRRHRAAANRQQLSHYQNWSMARPEPPDLDSTHNFWINRIQGFMHRQARGVEVPVNRP